MKSTRPTKIGSYILKTEFSDNGKTRVFQAIEDGFDTEVAVKFLPANFLQEPEFRLRFEREMQQIALMDHPAIVTMHDHGERDGQPYLITNWMCGLSLADWLTNGPLSLEKAVNIVGRVASALEAAHGKGIVHGDLKPTNILFDENGEAFLTEFCMYSQTAHRTTTIRNVIDGAPAYMSPEQAQGQALGPRSDIYALGALLFEMLAGVPPYLGETGLQLALQHLNAPVPRVTALRSDLPPACDEILARALAKDPLQRYATASELVHDLLDLVSSPKTIRRARTNPPASIEAIRPSRSPLLWIGLAAVTLLILGVLGSGFLVGILNFGKSRDHLVAIFAKPTPTTVSTPEPGTPTSAVPILTNTPLLIPTQTPTQKPTLAPRYTPTATVELPSPTPVYLLVSTLTATATSAPPIIGGADLLAFIHENDIYIAYMDGSQEKRLTLTKDVRKTDLEFTPDGQALTYIAHDAKNCVQILWLETQKIETIGCYGDFQISPDMSQVVIGDYLTFENETIRWQNFILPYSLSSLQSMRTIPQRVTSNGCPFFGGRLTRFSADGTLMAGVFEAPLGGRNTDTIQVYEYKGCGENIRILDAFPAQRFTMTNFSGPGDQPIIDEYAWDGEYLFALHGNKFNGFGDLVIYNMKLGRAEVINPVDNQCCYRDMRWSPDGQYFLFFFQDGRYVKENKLYYVPYGAIGTGVTYQPVNLPYYYFSDPHAHVEAALRRATTR